MKVTSILKTKLQQFGNKICMYKTILQILTYWMVFNITITKE